MEPVKEPQLYVIVGREGNLGAWTSTAYSGYKSRIECVHAFVSESDAWQFLLGESPSEEHEVAMRTAWRVLKVQP